MLEMKFYHLRSEIILELKNGESCTSSDEQLIYKISFFLSYLFF